MSEHCSTCLFFTKYNRLCTAGIHSLRIKDAATESCPEYEEQNAFEFVLLTDEDACPECNSELDYIMDEACACNTGHPPCSACVDAPLTCEKCGWKQEEN